MEELKRMVHSSNSLNIENIQEIIQIMNDFNISLCSEDEIVNIMFVYIDKLLSSPYHCYHGTNLLNDLIFKFPIKLVFEKVIEWAHICINISRLTSSQLSVIDKIIQICWENETFEVFIIQYVPKILNICIKGNYDEAITEQQLKCLKTCMEYYPQRCKLLGSEIEESLSFFISSTHSVQIIECAGSAFHTLQMIPYNLSRSDKKCNWTKQFYKICASMQEVYNTFLHMLDVDVYSYAYEIPPFAKVCFINTGSDYRSKQYQRYIQLRNLTIFASCMLREDFFTNKEMDLSIFFAVLKRGLRADIYDEQTLGNSEIMDLLQAHQTELLRLLGDFILCFNKNLIPINSVVTQIILSCQEISQTDIFAKNGDYKKALYDVIASWVLCSVSCGSSYFYNRVIASMLKEFNTRKENIVLRAIKNGNTTVRTELLDGDMKSYLEVQEEFCLSILNTLKVILTTGNVSLQDTTFDGLFQVLLCNIEAVQSGSPYPPFTNEKCVAALYQTFTSLFAQSIYRRQPLYNIAINILTVAQNSTVQISPELANVIGQSLQILGSFCRPVSVWPTF